MKTVIIGGVAGGVAAATRLRRLIGKGEIVVLERGRHISFSNCSLPYHIGNVIPEEETLVVQTPEQLKQRYDLDIRVRNEATAIDRTAKTVTVRNLETGEEYTETYDYLILAQGAAPLVPNLPGVDLPGVHTLRNVSDVHYLRAAADDDAVKSVLVVGGGFIGVEVAENYIERGKNVILAEFADQILAPWDYEMACFAQKELRQHGIDLRVGVGLSAIEQEGTALKATLSNGDSVTVDCILLSIGLRPEIELAQAAGLEIGETGRLLVDDHMRTNDPSIYAVGDMVELKNYVTGQPIPGAMAGPASQQARIAADNISGKDRVYKGPLGSSLCKVFSTTLAATGVNEKTLKKLGIKYDKIYCCPFSNVSIYPGASHLMMKLIYDPDTGKVLGAQAAGPVGADKRIDVLATAIYFGATIYDLQDLDLSYAPPYSTAKDPVNYLGYVAENVMTGQTKIFHWHDVADLPEFPFLVDVRADMDFFMGSIPDSMNISLNVLRERLDEFDEDETTYLVCREGLRGYIAECALRENGFTDVVNLSGGYDLWSVVNSELKLLNKK